MPEFSKMRRFKQEVSRDDSVRVLREAPRGVLALNGEHGYPYAIPMNHYFDEASGKLFFHCSSKGLKLDLIEANNKACFTVMDEGFRKEGDWALNITSVVCFGRIEAVANREEILEVCRKLAEKFYPDNESIEHEIAKAGQAVHMLVMNIDSMSGKLVNES